MRRTLRVDKRLAVGAVALFVAALVSVLFGLVFAGPEKPKASVGRSLMETARAFGGEFAIPGDAKLVDLSASPAIHLPRGVSTDRDAIISREWHVPESRSSVISEVINKGGAGLRQPSTGAGEVAGQIVQSYFYRGQSLKDPAKMALITLVVADDSPSTCYLAEEIAVASYRSRPLG